MSQPDYYNRSNVVHLDGTQIFQKPEDRRAEAEVAKRLNEAWGCELHSFGTLAPVDWYALRHGRMVGVLELKTRWHAADKYPTVMLNVRKWLALALASTGLGVPALYVVKFDDQIRWVPLTDVDASQIIIGGCSRRVKAINDIEPVILIPIGVMRELK